jgi:hypothetical protein
MESREAAVAEDILDADAARCGSWGFEDCHLCSLSEVYAYEAITTERGQYHVAGRAAGI